MPLTSTPTLIGRWTGVDWLAASATMSVPIDPYLAWADATDFQDFGLPRPIDRIPVIIELGSGTVASFASAIGATNWLVIPTEYLSPQLAGAKYFTAQARPDFFVALAAGNLTLAAVKRCEMSLAVAAFAGAPPPGIDASRITAPPSSAGGTPEVVVGLIDDGLPFANDRFLAGSVPRMHYLWDQNLSAKGTAPTGFGYGCEMDHALIKAAMAAAAGPGGKVDEELLYQQLGYMRCRRRQTHGSAVMDLLCGAAAPVIPPGAWPDEPNPLLWGAANVAPPAAPNWPIIGVQLPHATIADTAGLSLATQILDGVRYIIDRANSLNPTCRIIINLSLGEIAGPHDGSSMIESALADVQRVVGSRLQLFIAAGNNYLSRAHATRQLQPGESYDLRWRILPDDETPSFLELWVPYAAATRSSPISIEVAAPDGSTSGVVIPGQSPGLARAPADPVARIVFCQHPAGSSAGKTLALIALEPTASLSSANLAPCGVWTVTVRNASAQPQSFDAWIQRDDTPFGGRRYGRQSYFDEPGALRFDSKGGASEVDGPTDTTTRLGTLNSMGSFATRAPALGTTVGGYTSRNGKVPSYVSAGDTGLPGPSLMAPCEDSTVLRGVLAAGTHSNSTSALNGTSVASPQAAFWSASGSIGALSVVAPLWQFDASRNPIAVMPARSATNRILPRKPRAVQR